VRKTQEAGIIAGFDVSACPSPPPRPRPWRKTKKGGKIAVFDLGGGTFDIAISSTSAKASRNAINGDTHLGGDDDQVPADFIAEEFQSSTAVDLQSDGPPPPQGGRRGAKIESHQHGDLDQLLPITADASGPKH
jgi:molecular chaperone DnaK